MERNWHRHTGSYGISYDRCSNKLLVINKVTGPYGGRYDLPGGGIKPNETLLEGIRREFIEETGYTVEKVVHRGTHDFVVPCEYNGTTHTHHIANFFEVLDDVSKFSNNADINKELDYGDSKEVNDSAGVEWIKISELNKNNASPLVMVALKLINKELISSEAIYWTK